MKMMFSPFGTLRFRNVKQLSSTQFSSLRHQFLIVFIAVLFVSVAEKGAFSQQQAFFSSEVTEHIGNELSGELASLTVERLLGIQHISQSENYHRAFKFLESRAKELGLYKIRLAELPDSRIEWDVRKAELWMLSPVTRKLANFHANPASLAALSRTTHAMTELLDVNSGEKDQDYVEKEVQGKFVLAYGDLGLVMQQAVWKRGALGIICYPVQQKAPSQLYEPADWPVIPLSDSNGKPGTFAFSISNRTANELKRILQSTSDRTAFGRDKIEQRQTSILLRVDIDASVREHDQSWHLMAEIPGEEILSEDIVLTALLPDNAAPPFGDLSGAAGLLEIARTLTRLINDGLLPLPRRTIRFWWLPSHSALPAFFIRYPDAKDSLLANIHLASPGVASREFAGTQLTLAPHANINYWNDVLLSTAREIASLASKQAAENQNNLLDASFLYSADGTTSPHRLQVAKESENEILHFFSQPGIAISSAIISGANTSDLLSREAIKAGLQTSQYKRNLFLASVAVWYLSRFSDRDIPALVAAVYQNGQARLADALKIAFDEIIANGQGGYHLAELLIEERIARESEALQSISVLASHSDALEGITDFLNAYRDDAKSAQNRIKLLYSNIYQRRPPKQQLDANAKAALRLVPRNIPDLRRYLASFDPQANSWLLGEREVLYFINGQRSVYEIYRAVLAESMRVAGKSTSQISLQSVQATIRKAAKMGIVVF